YNESFSSFNGNINVAESNSNYTSVENVLFNKDLSTLIACPVTKTGNYIIPKTVTEINASAFANCSLIEGALEIPNNVTKIGNNAFHRCSNLTRIIIPSSVVSIGSIILGECTSLTEIYVYNTIPIDLSQSQLVFYNVDKTNCKLYVPKGSSAAYGSANQWRDFSNITEIDGFRISGNKRSIGANQNSSTNVDLYAYVSWTATSNRDWLFCTPTSGNYNATLQISADVNTNSESRIGQITISATGHPSRSITVTQASGPGIAVLNDLEIENRTFADQTVKCFGAHNSITVAGNGTNVDLENGSFTTLIAGQSIRFLPGFHAQAGSYVSAYITTTGSFCDDLPEAIMAAPPVTEKSLELVETDTAPIDFVEQSMVVYPNPNNGQFTIAFTKFEGASQVFLFNAMGQKVYAATV
ncbi:MAG TPA: leucine-rich repeat protein, partial [Prolixibacteraceae bacterium]|nr:leucine-rich repeat protein [Prolixibacteraceae bacterium]